MKQKYMYMVEKLYYYLGHTFRKPNGKKASRKASLSNTHTEVLITEAIGKLSIEESRNPGHVYARVLKNAIS